MLTRWMRSRLSSVIWSLKSGENFCGNGQGERVGLVRVQPQSQSLSHLLTYHLINHSYPLISTHQQLLVAHGLPRPHPVHEVHHHSRSVTLSSNRPFISTHI